MKKTPCRLGGSSLKDTLVVLRAESGSARVRGTVVYPNLMEGSHSAGRNELVPFVAAGFGR